jgi:hypothetical protein
LRDVGLDVDTLVQKFENIGRVFVCLETRWCFKGEGKSGQKGGGISHWTGERTRGRKRKKRRN